MKTKTSAAKAAAPAVSPKPAAPTDPYFHREGSRMELRIPFSRSQRAVVLKFLKALPEDESLYASFLALDGSTTADPDYENDRADRFLGFIESNPQNDFDVITKLAATGWAGKRDVETARRNLETWQQAGCPRPENHWDELAASIRRDLANGQYSPDERQRMEALAEKAEQDAQAWEGKE